MAMSATAIRFDEKVEEAADIKAYNEALMEDDGTRYSMDDVMRMAMEAE